MAAKPKWFPTQGIVGGQTVQFAEGRWDGEVGEGIGLNEAALALIEPYLVASCPEWTPEHRYGALELSPSSRARMVDALRQLQQDPSDGRVEESSLYALLADWLVERSGAQRVVSFLGY